MPLTRPLGGGLFEVRTRLAGHRISRIVFYIDARQRMVLLHGFIKKTQQTPIEDLNLAKRNKALHEKGLRG